MLTFKEQQEDLQENLAILGLVKRIGGLLGFNFATIKLIFEKTPLYTVVFLKLNFELTVCRFKHFLNLNCER